MTLLKLVNTSKSTHAKHFWDTLKDAKRIIHTKYKSLPLVLAQADTKQHAMSAVTLQVQLCEYRQFRHSIARNKYGLPDDETMRADPESEFKLRAENFIEFDKKTNCVKFEFP